MNKKLKRAHLKDLRTAISLNRRDFIYGMGASLGSVALAGMMSQHANASEAAPGPLAQKSNLTFHPRAKNCIFLMMEGGPEPDRHLRSETAVEQAAPAAVYPDRRGPIGHGGREPATM